MNDTQNLPLDNSHFSLCQNKVGIERDRSVSAQHTLLWHPDGFELKTNVKW